MDTVKCTFQFCLFEENGICLKSQLRIGSFGKCLCFYPATPAVKKSAKKKTQKRLEIEQAEKLNFS